MPPQGKFIKSQKTGRIGITYDNGNTVEVLPEQSKFIRSQKTGNWGITNDNGNTVEVLSDFDGGTVAPEYVFSAPKQPKPDPVDNRPSPLASIKPADEPFTRGDISSFRSVPKPQEFKTDTETNRRIKESTETRDKAVYNTVKRKFVNTGRTFDEKSPSFQNEIKKLKQKQIDGEVTVVKSKQGEPEITRAAGFGETFFNTIKNSVKQTIDAPKINSISNPKELADFLDEKAKDELDIPESAPSRGGGFFGETFGGAVKPIALLSMNALTAGVGTGVMSADAYQTSIAAHREQLYHKGLQENIEKGMPHDEARIKAAEQAMTAANIEAIPDAAVALALSGSGKSMKAATAQRTFVKALKVAAKDVSKMGGIGAVSGAAKAGIEALNGYKVSAQEAFERSLTEGKDLALMDMAFKIGQIPNIPSYLKASRNEYLSRLPKEIVQEKAVEMGQAGEQLTSELADYENARKKVEDVVPDEHLPQFAGLAQRQEKVSQLIKDLESSKEGLHPALVGKIDENIKEYKDELSAIDDRMKGMLKSDDPMSHEVDNITGEKVDTDISQQTKEVNDTGTTGGSSEVIPTNEVAAKEQGSQEALPSSVNEVGQGNAKPSDAVEVNSNDGIAVVKKTADAIGKIDEGSVKNIRSKIEDKFDKVEHPSKLHFLDDVLTLRHVTSKENAGNIIKTKSFGGREQNIDTPINGVYFSNQDRWRETAENETRFGNKKEGHLLADIDNDGLLYFNGQSELSKYLKQNGLPSEGQTLTADQLQSLRDKGIKGVVLKTDFASGTGNELIVLDESIIKNIRHDKGENTSYLPQSGLTASKMEIAKAYHKAKSDGSNPELVKAVEDAVAPTESLKFATNETSAENNTENKPIEQPTETEGNTIGEPNTEGQAAKEGGGEPPKEGRPVITDKASEDEWTAIRQSKLKEIDGVKRLYEKETGKKWSDIQQQGLEAAQKEHPQKTLYEAVKVKTEEIAVKYDDPNIDYNPTAKDLAVIQEFKRQTEKKISQQEQYLNSDNDIQRQAAIIQLESLNNDLINVGKALHKREAGTAFGYRQSESRMDANYGLQLRRMELIRAQGGEKLNADQMKWTADMWEKEKEILKKEQELREQSLKEDFDREIERIKNEYEAKIKDKTASAKTKTTSEKGKDLANKLRKLKTDKGSLKMDFTLGGWDLAVEGIAKLVEGGATIAEAIEKLIKDKEIGFKEEKDKDVFERMLVNALGREDALEHIKELAKVSGDTTLTNEMAKKAIQDYVNSHIGQFEQKDVFDAALKGLQEVLPDVDKKTLLEAYLREGDFKQPKKVDLENSLSKAKKELSNIAKLTEDIEDLEGLKGVRQRSFPSPAEKTAYEKGLIDVKKAKIKEIATRAAKIKSEYRKLRSEVDRQLKRVAELTEKKNKLERGIREKKAAKPSKIDTPEIEALKEQVKKADADLRAIEVAKNKAMREAQSRQDKIGELDANIERAKRDLDLITTHKNKSAKKIDDEIDLKKRELKKAIADNSSDEREQKPKLEQTKKRIQSDIEQLQRRIATKDFLDDKKNIALRKHDIELIKLEKQKSILEAQFKLEQRRLMEQSKTKLQRGMDFSRGLFVNTLIGGTGTYAKIGLMALTRPFSEALTKTVGGNLFDVIHPKIGEAAKRGGEGQSLRVLSSLWGAFFRQMGEAKMQKIFAEANDAAIKADKALEDYQNSANPDAKKIQELENIRNGKVLDAMSNIVYQFIGGSSIKDAVSALVNRSNKIEEAFGGIEPESFKDGNWLDKTGYVISFIGRSHSALKTFSGRASFAAGFMARIEAAMKDGTLSNPDRIIEIAHESYLDFERGKYQQDNYISEKWNQATKALSQKMQNHPEWDKYNTTSESLARGSVPITRVPINILWEEVAEYTFGAFTSLYKAAKEIKNAKKAAELEGLMGDDFKRRVSDIVSNMDEKQAATIKRCFRKGGLGVGLYAFALISGMIHFGVFPHLGQKKKKEEHDLREDELNPGQVQVGNTKLGEVASGAIEHTPVLWPMFMGLGMARIYKDDLAKGKDKRQAAWDAAYTHLQVVEGGVPQAKLFGVTKITEGAAHAVKKRLTETGLIEPKEAAPLHARRKRTARKKSD